MRNNIKSGTKDKKNDMRNVIGTVMIVILAMLLVGALPTWPHSSNWVPLMKPKKALSILEKV
jgi:hypothetical protein